MKKITRIVTVPAVCWRRPWPSCRRAKARPGEPSDCDHACLSQFVRDYMAALAKRNAASLKQAKTVRFTENNVELPFGKEGMWATVTGVAPTGLIAADAQTGQVAWLGTAEENGKPVYFALRLAVRDGAHRRSRDRRGAQHRTAAAFRRRHARWCTTRPSTTSCRRSSAARASACAPWPMAISIPSSSTTAMCSRRSTWIAAGSRTAS